MCQLSERTKILVKFTTSSHSVYLLYYHLVLVTKYRKKILDETVSSYLKNLFLQISHKYDILLKEWNHDKDNINILFEAKPNSNLSKFIMVYKSFSSRLVKSEFPNIRTKYWKEFFWSQSYCLLTTGGAPIDIIKKYIENQGK